MHFDFDTIFRSIISIKNSYGNETISQKDLIENYKHLQKIDLKLPEQQAYTKLFSFIKDYYNKCDPDLISLPSMDIIRNHFTYTENSEATTVLLDKISSCQPYVGMDYRTVVKSYVDQCNILEFSKVLNISNTIASNGYDLVKGKRKTRLKGLSDAISYMSRETKKLEQSDFDIITEGQVISDKSVSESLELYSKTSRDPTGLIGIYSWLSAIDGCTGGLKSGELMIVTAFTGHCKTTFSLNQVYRAIYGGWNSCFVSLEMGYEEIRDKIYVLHSSNPKFKKLYPRFEHLVGTLSYNNVRYGQLTDEEMDYYQLVLKDLTDADSGYGKLFIWQPLRPSTTLSDIALKFREYQQECQMDGMDLDFGVIDYLSLLGADDHERARDGNETLNNIVKSLKRLCLTFNNGKGIRILSPHQANREGYKKAMSKDNEGIYDLTALSNAHEIERSADLVISIYRYDDRVGLKFCCLKNRRNKFFKPFDASIHFDSGFIYDCADDFSIFSTSGIDMSDVAGN